jgi:hypothetical protein
MKKIKLSVDELEIETFTLGRSELPDGTVHGRDGSGELTVYPELTCLCTHDPYAPDCYVSDIYCSEAEPCHYTRSTTCTCNPECP